MSVNKVNSDGSLLRVAGGTLYADAPIGTISSFGGSVIPNGYLLCNGAEVLKTAYAELYAVIGDAFGTASDNTKFVLPDLRESVPKGAGLTGKTVGAHLDADGLAVGEFLDDRLQDYFAGGDLPTYIGGESGVVELGSGNYSYYVGNQRRELTATRRGATTEVKAVGVNYIIKAKQVAVPADFSKSLVGYVGEETAYNLYQWSDTRAASTDPATYLDFVVEQDGWYSIDFALAQLDGDTNGFAIRDFDEQGGTHAIGRGEITGCTYYRSNIIVPLKAGTYRYHHSGKGTLNVYMNHRDFA